MILGESADAHQRRRHRDLASLGKLEKLGSRICRDDPSTGVNHRTPRRLDQADYFVERDRISLGWERIAPQSKLIRKNRLSRLVLDIFWEINNHGAWSPGLGDVKRLPYDAGDLVDIHDKVAVLFDGECHSEHVGFLERAA